MAISLLIPKHCWVIWLVLLGAAHANPLDESYVQDVTITTPSPGKTPPFGPDPWATAPSLQKTPNPIGRGLFNFYGCITCHNLPISPFANRRGPDLDRIGDKTHSAWLSRWLHDPETVLPNTRMPHIPLTTAERDTLVHFLMDQRGKTPLPISQKG
ncbi:MAG: cbb3-type cytochrome c oxidase subunit II, partial [bacterium]|nr:cbb3-type cytochrome c oxidase subunit II [bacterium]